MSLPVSAGPVSLSLPAARAAMLALLEPMYAGWSDAAIGSEPGGSAFLVLRAAVVSGSPGWLALSAAFLAGEFRGWSDADIRDCGAADFLAARSAVRLAALLAPAGEPACSLVAALAG